MINSFTDLPLKAEHKINDDANVHDIVNLYFEGLKDSSYKTNRKSYYDRKVKKHLGKVQAKKVLPMHIKKIIDTIIREGDSHKTAKQALEALHPHLTLQEPIG